MARCGRLLWLACCMLLLGGCSIVKLAYRNADTLTLRWLDRYVELDDTQSAWAKAHIGELHAWHRTTQLPAYVKLLHAQRALVQQGGMTQADVLALNASISAQLDAMAMKALPDLAVITLQLRPEQISAIEAKFAKNNADFRKEFLEPDVEQQQESRYKTVLWLAEVLFGRFSSEQEAEIRRRSDARPLMNELWMTERLTRQRDLLALLRRIQAEKPPQDNVMTLLKAHAVRATGIAHIPNPADRARAESAAAHAAQLGVAIVNMTTPEQKRRAVAKLTQWADDLNELSRE